MYVAFTMLSYFSYLFSQNMARGKAMLSFLNVGIPEKLAPPLLQKII